MGFAGQVFAARVAIGLAVPSPQAMQQAGGLLSTGASSIFEKISLMRQQASAKNRGIALSEQTLETSEMTSVVGYVVKMGNMCYKDKEKFLTPWCKEGQWVCIGRYSGSRFKIEGGEVRIINDDEVIATILEPDDVKHI